MLLIGLKCVLLLSTAIQRCIKPCLFTTDTNKKPDSRLPVKHTREDSDVKLHSAADKASLHHRKHWLS